MKFRDGMRWSFQERHTFGKQKEQELLPTLRAVFGENLQPHPNQVSRYDFQVEGGNRTVELKSRTNSMGRYPTTLLRANKIRDTTDDQYFCFNFTDGIGYIKYDPDIFRTFGTRYAEKYNEGLHYEIPVKSLIPIERIKN